MRYIKGEGARLRLVTGKVFGRDFIQEIPTDLAMNIRVIGIERDRVTQPKPNSGAAPQKFHRITFAQRPFRQAQVPITRNMDAKDMMIAMLLNSRNDNNRRPSNTASLMVFENDRTAEGKSCLTLFDGIKEGDLINASVQRMTGGNGYKAYAVEKSAGVTVAEPGTEPLKAGGDQPAQINDDDDPLSDAALELATRPQNTPAGGQTTGQ